MRIFSTHLSIVIGFGLAVVLAIRVVREQRPTGSTFAWLLAILLIPYVGVPLYILFGGRKIAYLAGTKEPLYGDEPPVRDNPFLNDTERILVNTGAPSPTLGNEVSMLPDGETAYRRLIDLIRGAEHSIDITTFILGSDEVGRSIVDELCQKAAQGIRVRLLIDALGSLKTRGRFLMPLRRAGGQVGVFMPMLPWRRKWSANLRNHRKLMVFDGTAAYIGGMNLAGEYMGPVPDPARWADFGVILEGPVVAQIHGIFASDWYFATNEHLKVGPVSDPVTQQSLLKPTSIVQVVASGPDVASDSFYHGLLTAFAEAKSRIWIVSPYFIPDNIICELLELAARLGRDVRVLIPIRSNHPLADLARGSYIRDLMRAGVKFFGYEPGMLHAKIIVIDQAMAITGSANLDIRSLYLNYEIGIFIHSREEVEKMVAHVVSLFARSLPFSVADETHWVRNWFEDAGRLIAPLL